MPTYDYRCTECGATWEEQIPIAQRDEPLSFACPACETERLTIERYLPSPPGSPTHTGDSISKRTPEAFKDVLRNIKSKHRHSTINV